MLKKTFFLFSLLLLFLVCGQTAKAEDTYDLTPVSITLNPVPTPENYDVTITVRVYNYGNAAIKSSLGVLNYSYAFADFTLSTISVTEVTYTKPLSAGGFVDYVFKGKFNSSGKKKLTFIANKGASLVETNMTNNKIEVEKDIIKNDVDLKVEEIKVIPATPAVNTEALIKVKVKNNGTVNIYTYKGIDNYFYKFDNFIKLDASYTEISNLKKFAPGAYIYYTFRGKFLDISKKKLVFTLDSTDNLEETDESNNTIEKSIDIVADQKDLAIESVKFEPAKPIVNKDVKITVVIKNNGPASLLDDSGLKRTDLKLDYSGLDVTSRSDDWAPSSTNPLESGEKYSYVFKGKYLTSGMHKFDFAFDINNSIFDLKRGNNSTSTAIKVYENQSEVDDFVISNISYRHASNSAVIIYWNTDRNTTGEVMYKTRPQNEYWKKSDSKSITKHSMELNKLNHDTEYLFKIKATLNDVVKYSDEYKFTTYLDNKLVLLGDPVQSTAGKKIKISWRTNFISSNEFYYKIKGSSANYAKVTASSSLDAYLVDLQPKAGIYEYYIEAKNRTTGSIKTKIYYFTVNGEVENGGDVNAGSSDSKTQTVQTGSVQAAVFIKNKNLYQSLKGKIILRVGAGGAAYYINPNDQKRYYLGRPNDAFAVMRERGIGISNADIAKISVGLTIVSGQDTDKDGLSDLLEDAIGTNKNVADTDSDKYKDADELKQGFNPKGAGKQSIDNNFAGRQSGKILLQIQGKGEAWYVNPKDNKRYFLGRQGDAFNVMRNLGLGISEENFLKL